MNIRDRWQKLSKLPGHRLWFHLLLRNTVRYSATIPAQIESWEVGNIRVSMKDRPSVRNHLNSVHAVALMNLCELTSGLCVLSTLPDTVKGIPVRFSIDFKKKGRGLLVAEAQTEPRVITERTEFSLKVDVKDAAQDLVCSAEVLWLLQPK